MYRKTKVVAMALYLMLVTGVMSCMRVCRKQALSRVKYYYYATISQIQQATIMTV